MSHFDIYVFVLCLIVFIILTACFTTFIVIYVSQQLKLISLGAEDEKIKAEYLKSKVNEKRNKALSIFDRVIFAFFSFLFVGAFCFSMCVNIEDNKVTGNIPTIQVVQTASMQSKFKDNTYLFKNNLNNQISAFDVVVTHKLPKEEELKLYDIVVYEVDGVLIIHRIVGIEEPNKEHPNERWFLLQGDAVKNPDRFPVLYSQMKGIYKNEKIPFIGSFVMFMQSPAGYLCMIFVAVSIIAVPICERKLKKAYKERLSIMGLINASSANENIEFNSEEKLESNLESENSNVLSTALLQGNGEEELQPTKQEDAIEESENNFVIEQETIENELAITEELEENGETINPFASIIGVALPFVEKLKNAPIDTKNRYQKIVEFLARIDGIRVINGKKFETYKYKNVAILRFAIRGKTLNAYLGLNASEYENSKYVFENVSNKSAFKNYQMRVKITSERQARWTLELLNDIVNKNGLKLNEVLKLEEVKFEQVENTTTGEIEAVNIPFAFHMLSKNTRTFAEKLAVADSELKSEYLQIKEHLYKVKGLTVTCSNKFETYKCGSVYIAKLAIKGKTLNVYLGLNPQEYLVTKYVFTDVSSVNAFKNYGMRVKVSSVRQVKWTKELISELASKKGLFMYAISKLIIIKGNDHSFNERLENANEFTKQAYEKIHKFLINDCGCRIIEGKKACTYKKGNKCVAKIRFTGKTISVYLAINVKEYAGSKYKFTNVSKVKAYENYPMKFKLTSQRKVKHVIELLNNNF